MVGLALAVRLAYVFQARGADPMFADPVLDAMFHHQWALAIVRGGWLAGVPFFRAPGYGYFLAGIYRLFGAGPLAPRLVQAGLGALSCGLVYVLARRVMAGLSGGTAQVRAGGRSRTGQDVALAAGLAAAFYPLLVYFDGELLIPSLLVFLVLAGMVLLYRFRKLDRLWFLPGLAWGLAAVTRPNVLVFVVLAAVWFAAEFGRGMARRYLLFLAGVAVVILPVTVRNYAVSGEVIPIAWQGGTNFWIGNNPESDGVTAIAPGTRKDWWGGYYDIRRLAKEKLGREPRFGEIDRYGFRQGLRFWKERPGQALGLSLRKLYLFLSGYEVANNRDIYFFSRFTFLRLLIHRLPLFFFPFGLLVPLAAAGALVLRQQWRRLLPLYLFIGGYALSFVPFFVTARYRMPLVPFLLVLAAVGVWEFARRVRNGRGWLAPALVFVLLYVPLNLNLAGLGGTNEAQVYSILAGHEAREGSADRAEQYLDRARRADPEWTDQYFVAGLLARRRGNDSAAAVEFRTAINRDPANPDYHVYLGDLFYDRGELDSAEVQYGRALELDPRSAFALCHLGNVLLRRGQLESALESYRRATELIPDYTVAIYNVGLAWYRLGDEERAREWWQRVVEVDPEHRLARQVREWLDSH